LWTLCPALGHEGHEVCTKNTMLCPLYLKLYSNLEHLIDTTFVLFVIRSVLHGLSRTQSFSNNSL